MLKPHFMGILTICLVLFALVGPSAKAQTQIGLKPETKQHKEKVSRTIYVTGSGSWSSPPPSGMNFTVAIVTCNVYVYSTECVDCPTGATCTCIYSPPTPPAAGATVCGYAPYPNTPPVTPP